MEEMVGVVDPFKTKVTRQYNKEYDQGVLENRFFFLDTPLYIGTKRAEGPCRSVLN